MIQEDEIMKGRHVTWQKAVTQEDEIMKGRHVTLQKAVTFKGRFFVVTDFFSCWYGHTYMLVKSNLKMTFSFAIVSYIEINTLKFIKTVETKI